MRRDGTAFPVAYSCSSVPLGERSGNVLVFRDVSDRKAKEDEARHRLGELSWLGRVRDAIDQDRLLVYAQPIVEPASGDVVQEELLVRMPAVTGGTPVAPEAFLPVAERYGLIREVDSWMVRQAVRRAKRERAVAA